MPFIILRSELLSYGLSADCSSTQAGPWDHPESACRKWINWLEQRPLCWTMWYNSATGYPLDSKSFLLFSWSKLAEVTRETLVDAKTIQLKHAEFTIIPVCTA